MAAAEHQEVPIRPRQIMAAEPEGLQMEETVVPPHQAAMGTEKAPQLARAAVAAVVLASVL